MTSTAATEELPATEPMLYSMTADQFIEMIEAGIIPEERRVSLIDGRLYEEMGKSKPNSTVSGWLTMSLADQLLKRNAAEPGSPAWVLWPEGTIKLSPTDAPMPDFAVVRHSDNLLSKTTDRYPGADDVGLVIEVGVTSLKFDLTTKLERYALAGIKIYWVIDVEADRILVHSQPTTVDGRGVYSKLETYSLGQSVPLVLDDSEIALIPVASIIR